MYVTTRPTHIVCPSSNIMPNVNFLLFSFILIFIFIYIFIFMLFYIIFIFYPYFKFQARGTPHVHSLICISNLDGIDNTSIDSVLQSEQDKVKWYVQGVVSSNFVANPHRTEDSSLLSRDDVPVETDYNWNPDKDYFRDEYNPCRDNFDPSLNYERSCNGDFLSAQVQQQYRRLQIANQFHRCCFTCFKYCHKHDKVCRFGFPWTSMECFFGPVIVKDRDKKSRVRVSVLPQRNNAYINGTCFAPLITIAHGGNHDLQYIGNTVGAAEYVASYASKFEEPDKKVLTNIFNKKIAYLSNSVSNVTDRDRLYSVGCALLGSSPVGSVQACYSLLGLKFVNSSRRVLNVNSLHRTYLLFVFILNPSMYK